MKSRSCCVVCVTCEEVIISQTTELWGNKTDNSYTQRQPHDPGSLWTLLANLFVSRKASVQVKSSAWMGKNEKIGILSSPSRPCPCLSSLLVSVLIGLEEGENPTSIIHNLVKMKCKLVHHKRIITRFGGGGTVEFRNYEYDDQTY